MLKYNEIKSTFFFNARRRTVRSFSFFILSTFDLVCKLNKTRTYLKSWASRIALRLTSYYLLIYVNLLTTIPILIPS